MDCIFYVAKTKALISFAVTAKLICVFVFAYAKRRLSHNESHLMILFLFQCHQELFEICKMFYCFEGRILILIVPVPGHS